MLWKKEKKQNSFVFVYDEFDFAPRRILKSQSPSCLLREAVGEEGKGKPHNGSRAPHGFAEVYREFGHIHISKTRQLS